MSLVIPPGFGNAVYRFSLTGDAEEMVTTIGVDLGEWSGDFEAAAAALNLRFRTAYPAGNLLGGYTFVGVTLYVGQDGAPPDVYEDLVSVTGTNEGPALPPNCAFLVSKRTATAGRRGRGRCYLPAGVGVGEDSVPATGVMAEAQRVALQARVNTWTDPTEHVLLHDELSPGGFTPTPITSFIMRARLATVRRRLRP
jgi:hypothetical protein